MQPTPFVWVGGEHDFLLKMGNLRALQSACDAGPNQIFERIRSGDWLVDDLFETIRQGLIGGGMKGTEASTLCLSMFERHPLREFENTAMAILIASLVGVEDDPVGEPEGATPPPENGVSPSSTETEPK